jgi:hypothetical protein
MDHDISLSFIIPWACKLMLLACMEHDLLSFAEEKEEKEKKSDV